MQDPMFSSRVSPPTLRPRLSLWPVLAAGVVLVLFACTIAAFSLFLLLWYLFLLAQLVTVLLDMFVQVLVTLIFSLFPSPQFFVLLVFGTLLSTLLWPPNEPPEEPQPK